MSTSTWSNTHLAHSKNTIHEFEYVCLIEKIISQSEKGFRFYTIVTQRRSRYSDLRDLKQRMLYEILLLDSSFLKYYYDEK